MHYPCRERTGPRLPVAYLLATRTAYISRSSSFRGQNNTLLMLLSLCKPNTAEISPIVLRAVQGVAGWRHGGKMQGRVFTRVESLEFRYGIPVCWPWYAVVFQLPSQTEHLRLSPSHRIPARKERGEKKQNKHPVILSISACSSFNCNINLAITSSGSACPLRAHPTPSLDVPPSDTLTTVPREY